MTQQKAGYLNRGFSPIRPKTTEFGQIQSIFIDPDGVDHSFANLDVQTQACQAKRSPSHSQFADLERSPHAPPPGTTQSRQPVVISVGG